MRTKPPSAQLTIIFTTRSPQKASQTLQLLRARLSKESARQSHRRPGLPKVHFQPENVELTSLLSVRALASHLLSSGIPHLDAIILNAGAIGIVGLNWPQAIWCVLIDLVDQMTWPSFKITAVGLVTKPQLPPVNGRHIPEPPLGEVFCANLFGHYLLTHWLMPLLHSCPAQQSPGKVIWISSVECAAVHFDSSDLQGLRSPKAYEHSKRLTDLLALTAHNQPSTARYVNSFLDPTLGPSLYMVANDNLSKSPLSSSSSSTPPEIHLIQPGVCVTSMVPLHWIMQLAFILAAYLSRLLGSPWAVVQAYNGAQAISWLTLSDATEIELHKTQNDDGATGVEDVGAAVKWGAATDRRGRLSVRKTEVEGWGLDGSGQPYVEGWWGGNRGWGRRRDAIEATPEHVDRFVESGTAVWREMEILRDQWETRLVEFDRLTDTAKR